MKIRLHTLWKVPVFCICAGYLSFYLTVLIVSKFGIVTLPDGSSTVSNTFQTILEILLFIINLGLAYLLVRNMTRKEIFWSATIIVVIQLIFQLIQLIVIGTSLDIQLGLWLTYATEWCRIISYTCYLITKNAWIGGFLICFAPYIFVLFGKKQQT